MADAVFPTDFAAIADVDATDDLAVPSLDGGKIRIALGQIRRALFRWNKTNVSQVNVNGDIGSPVNPDIQVASLPDQANDALNMTLDAATPSGAGRVWFFSTDVPVQSVRGRFSVGIDAANPIQPGESIMAGVSLFGSYAGNGLGILLQVDDAGASQLIIATNTAFGVTETVAYPTPVSTPGGYFWIVDFDLTAQLRDTTTYTPNGAPAVQGTVRVNGVTSAAPIEFPLNIAASDWDPSVGALDSNKAAVFVVAGTPLTATTGLIMPELLLDGRPA